MDEKDKAMWVHTLWDPLEKMDNSPLHSKKDGIKVAAYCRVSLDSLNISESLESQVSHYTHFIGRKKNWKFVGIYFDNLVSGRKASLRQGFTRMLRHCDEGKIDLILVKNVSRFSRNAKELIEIVERLKEINVTVYFEMENIESTRSDTTYLLNIFASVAQAEIEAISYNIKWSYEKRTLEGKADIGDMYGYDKAEVNGETIIKINEEEAQIVREIFVMYLNGYSSYKIAGELSRRNIKTKQGKKLWNSSTITGILSNISYTGDILVRKTIQDMLTNKIRSAKGIEDQYFIENHHPAIISKEVFEQVQKKIKKNGKPSSPPTRRYNPLLKRVHCGNCGHKFNRNKNRGKDYFKCVSKMTNKSLCVSPVIKEDDIIKIMLGGFKERFDIENPKIIKMLQRFLIRINQNDHFEFHRLKALTQIQLAKSLRGVEYTDEDIEQMEESYKEFEKELVKIEDDRKFRLEAIKWLDTVENFGAFENQATIEYMRGWIKEITIYSLNDYKIHWIDGKNTEIGSCISIKPELEEPLVDENLIELQIKGSFEENKITLEKGGDIQSKEGVMVQAAKRLKSEKKSDLMFLNIKKQINNSVVMQTTVPIPSKKKLKVAAYIRVSTESDQQEISLKTQYTYFLYYILRDPQYILVDIYIDDGKSGLTTKGRTEFNRLIDDCVDSKVNLIITKSLSRFARNTVDTLKYLNLLKNLDPPVNVWFQKENLYSLDEKSDLLIKLLSVIGQEESLNMGESIAWAKRSLAQRGIVNPGRLAYGYYYGENKEWLINKEEEKVVKRIYKEYQEGKKIQKIAKGLESESIPSPSGRKNWDPNTIKDILISETYRGNYVFQKFYNSSGLIKKKTKNQGELPMYFIENHHQPIIDSEEWENIQEIMKIRDKERQDKIEKYLPDTKKNEAFSKKLYCEKCHSYLGYIRQVDRGKNNKGNRHWRCYSARKGKGCDSIHLKQEYIEENFSQCLMDIRHNEAFRKYINQYKESVKITPEEEKLRERLNLEREELNQKLYAEVEGELNKKGKDAKQVDKLIDKIMKLRQQINTFTQREEQLELIEEDIAAIMKSLKDYKDNKKTGTGYYMKAPKFNKEIFEEHIEKGTVAGDGKIIYKFKSGFEWAAPIDYSNFQIKARRKIAAKRAKEKAEYLKGPEVTELLEYCIEPKTFKEMQNFLGKYTAYHSFRKHILVPLLKQGIVKMTIPDQPVHRLQKYYSVDRKKRN